MITGYSVFIIVELFSWLQVTLYLLLWSFSVDYLPQSHCSILSEEWITRFRDPDRMMHDGKTTTVDPGQRMAVIFPCMKNINANNPFRVDSAVYLSMINWSTSKIYKTNISPNKMVCWSYGFRIADKMLSILLSNLMCIWRPLSCVGMESYTIHELVIAWFNFFTNCTKLFLWWKMAPVVIKNTHCLVWLL